MYKYTLKYEIDGTEVVMTFPGDVNIEQIRNNLRYFLLGCSWMPNQVDEILGSDDD